MEKIHNVKISNKMMKERLESDCRLKNSNGLENHSNSSDGLLAWPTRKYGCSFCRREFRSAQALGGHMNVHRRDRAKLRSHLPSWLFKIPNPNPNPNSNLNPNPNSSPSPSPSSSSHPIKLSIPYPSSTTHKFSSSFVCPSISSSAPYMMEDLRNGKRKGSIEESKICSKAENYDIKKEEVISLDLEIGFKDPKDVMDLELRLGCF